MRRGGSDQSGRDEKYKVTERYIACFINPPKRLMKIASFKSYDDKGELFLLKEEKKSIKKQK